MSTVPKAPNSPQETNFISPPKSNPQGMVLTAKTKLFQAREQLDTYLSQLGLTDAQLVILEHYITNIGFWENSVSCWEIIAQVKGENDV
ncbi:MAG: hypothetical protein HC875_29455 [Anaerolineales bacterium]|nr:hypothetical protein [Anaerolineales bacterium]